MHVGRILVCSTKRRPAIPAPGAKLSWVTHLQSLSVFSYLGNPLISRTRRFVADEFGVNISQPSIVRAKEPTINDYLDPTQFGEQWPIQPQDQLVLPNGNVYTIHAINNRVDNMIVMIVEVPLQ